MAAKPHDPWDAFNGGSSDDDNDDDDDTSGRHCCHEPELQIASSLAQRFLQADSSIPLHDRRILILAGNSRSSSDLTNWKDAFCGKLMHGVEIFTDTQSLNDSKNDDNLLFDAVLVSSSLETQEMHDFAELIQSVLVPGGLLMYCVKYLEEAAFLKHDFWDVESQEDIACEHEDSWRVVKRWHCHVASEACQWLPRRPSINDNARRLLSEATIALSVHERTTATMSTNSIRRAVVAMQKHGYCLVLGMLYTERQHCLDFGAAVVADLHAADAILQKEGINLHHPAESQKDPETYRELSMREDCRMDLRHGPALQEIRGCTGNAPVTIQAAQTVLKDDFLRGNANILTIVRRVMNPVISKELSAGNFGRYNFDGSGPDGSYQDLNAGVVGGIISLPGAADQAVHADTPHLFENSPEPLPAHYINVFTPGCIAVDNVGQTAIVHGSHRLDFVANFCKDQHSGSNSLKHFDPTVWSYLVRPRLNVGDVLLFDCRILHFGLANTQCERPMLYVNMTMHWFHDPKNWDQHKRIFAESVTNGDFGTKVSIS